MAASGSQTITPRQLIILEYMALRKRADKRNQEGWTFTTRMEREITFERLWPPTTENPHNHRRPIQEELVGTADGIFPLSGKRNASELPYLISHPGGQAYRITEKGIQMVETCTIGKRKVPNEPGKFEFLVIDKSTNRPPVIESTDMTPVLEEDRDQDETTLTAPAIVDLDEPRQPSSTPQQHQNAPASPSLPPDMPEVDEGTDETGEGLEALQGIHDEINEPVARGMSIAPPAPKPKAPAKRPAHRKARVPGQG